MCIPQPLYRFIWYWRRAYRFRTSMDKYGTIRDMDTSIEITKKTISSIYYRLIRNIEKLYWFSTRWTSKASVTSPHMILFRIDFHGVINRGRMYTWLMLLPFGSTIIRTGNQRAHHGFTWKVHKIWFNLTAYYDRHIAFNPRFLPFSFSHNLYFFLSLLLYLSWIIVKSWMHAFYGNFENCSSFGICLWFCVNSAYQNFMVRTYPA